MPVEFVEGTVGEITKDSVGETPKTINEEIAEKFLKEFLEDFL